MPYRILINTMVMVLNAGVISMGTFAQEAPTEDNTSKRAGLGIYMDQDLLLPVLNEDRDYTMGLAFELFWDDQPKYLRSLDNLLEKINSKASLIRNTTRFQRSLILGSISYTPDNLSNPNPIYNDRPYSSLIYVSSKRVFAKECDKNGDDRSCRDTVVGTELQIGCLGLDISKTVQTSIHKNMRAWRDKDQPVDPMGWPHQISDGGEPTVRYRVSYGQQLLGNRLMDVAYTTDASVGYQTNMSFGMQTRWGRTHSGFWTLPFDPINRGNFIPSHTGDEVYVWAVYRARAVAYDALLQGQFRHSDVTFGSSDIERVVFESGVGLTCAFEPMQFTLSGNFKSSELKGDAERSHWWGGCYLVRMF
jgi:hypothetical protein